MKIKYIFSMVAGLLVLVTASCKEKTTTDSGPAEKPAEETAKAGTPESAPAPEKPEAPAEATPSAYYVMFSGKGWGIGKRASSALTALEGVDSVVLSGLRATVKMSDGTTLDEKLVTDALKKKGLGFVSKNPATAEAPKVVYVLNVSGVGWSETEEKARVALAEVDNVTNVYVGKKTEIWMTEDGSLDEDTVTAMLKGFGFKLGGMEKTDKSAL